MDKVQKYNSFNTNTPSSESYRNYLDCVELHLKNSLPTIQQFDDYFLLIIFMTC
jgi:hypothetical protein